MAYSPYNYAPYQNQMFNPYQFPQYNGQPMNQQMNPQINQNQQHQIQPQIQSGGFVVVQSEDEVRKYPVALGTSIDFKIENQPIVIEKTMGFSQLDSPRYERFRLVKEDAPEINEKASNCAGEKQDIEIPINELKRKIEALEQALADLEKKVDSNLPQKTASKKASKNDPDEA